MCEDGVEAVEEEDRVEEDGWQDEVVERAGGWPCHCEVDLFVVVLVWIGFVAGVSEDGIERQAVERMFATAHSWGWIVGERKENGGNSRVLVGILALLVRFTSLVR